MTKKTTTGKATEKTADCAQSQCGAVLAAWRAKRAIPKDKCAPGALAIVPRSALVKARPVSRVSPDAARAMFSRPKELGRGTVAAEGKPPKRKPDAREPSSDLRESEALALRSQIAEYIKREFTKIERTNAEIYGDRFVRDGDRRLVYSRRAQAKLVTRRLYDQFKNTDRAGTMLELSLQIHDNHAEDFRAASRSIEAARRALASAGYDLAKFLAQGADQSQGPSQWGPPRRGSPRSIADWERKNYRKNPDYPRSTSYLLRFGPVRSDVYYSAMAIATDAARSSLADDGYAVEFVRDDSIIEMRAGDLEAGRRQAAAKAEALRSIAATARTEAKEWLLAQPSGRARDAIVENPKVEQLDPEHRASLLGHIERALKSGAMERAGIASLFDSRASSVKTSASNGLSDAARELVAAAKIEQRSIKGAEGKTVAQKERLKDVVEMRRALLEDMRRGRVESAIEARPEQMTPTKRAIESIASLLGTVAEIRYGVQRGTARSGFARNQDGFFASVSLRIRSNGHEDDAAASIVAGRWARIATPLLETAAEVHGSWTLASQARPKQYGPRPFGFQDTKRAGASEASGLRSTSVKLEFFARTSAEVIEVTRDIDVLVSDATLVLRALGYEVDVGGLAVGYPLHADGSAPLIRESIEELTRKVIAREELPEPASTAMADEPAASVADEVEPEEPRETDEQREARRNALHQRMNADAAELARAWVRSQSPELIEWIAGDASDLRDTVLASKLRELLATEQSRAAQADVGETIPSVGDTNAEARAIDVGYRAAAGVAAELLPRIKHRAKPLPMAPAGIAYAAGVRMAAYKNRWSEPLSRLPAVRDDEGMFGHALYVGGADESEASELSYSRPNLVAPGGNEPTISGYLRPEAGDRVAMVDIDAPSAEPIPYEEFAYALAAAEPQLVVEGVVQSVGTTNGRDVIEVANGKRRYRVESSGLQSPWLAWSDELRLAIDSRSTPTKIESELRLGRAKPVPAPAPTPAKDDPAPVAPAISSEPPAQWIEAKKRFAASVAKAEIIVRLGKGAIDVYGKGTFGAKELLKKPPFNMRFNGMDKTWGMPVPWMNEPENQGAIPWLFVYLCDLLSKQYKIQVELPSTFDRWQTQESWAQAPKKKEPSSELQIHYSNQAGGVWFLVAEESASRAAKDQFKNAGWSFQSARGKCERRSCAACAAGLMWTWFTSDPNIAATMRGSMNKDATAALAVAEKDLNASRATDGEISCPLPRGIKLYGYQKAGVAYALERTNVLIADEMGLGKTPQSIVALNCDHKIKRVLVLCPASLRMNWAREVKVFSSRPTRVVRIKDFGAPRKNETPAERDARYQSMNLSELSAELPGDEMLFAIAGYEQAMTKAGSAFDAVAWDAIILDESQHVKNAKAKRTERTRGLWSKTSKRRFMLTGTPIENNLDELYNLLSFLDDKTWPPGGKLPGRYKYNASERKKLEIELRKRFMVRRLKADVLLDLPEKRWSIRYLDPDEAIAEAARQWSETKAKYKLSDDPSDDEKDEDLRARMLVAEAIGDRDEIRRIAGEMTNAGGAAFEEISRVRAFTGLAKTGAAIEHIAALLDSKPADDKHLVVWCHHYDAAVELQKGIAAAGYTAKIATGREPADVRGAIVAEFQAGKLNVAVCTINAMGTGHTMTRANHAVFVEFPWAPSKLVQAEDRIHRIGQKRGVLIEYLVAEDTIDARMMHLIQQKEMLAESTLDNEQIVQTNVADRSGDAAKAIAEKKLAGDGGSWDPEAWQRNVDDELKHVRAITVRRTDAIYAFTPEEKALLHGAMSRLQGACDGAQSKDFCGFAGPDVKLGWHLAFLPANRWTDAAATIAYKLSIKYRGQLGGETLDRVKRPISTEETRVSASEVLSETDTE